MGQADGSSWRRGGFAPATATVIAATWQPTKVEVAKSGDLGYSTGTNTITMNDEKGKPVTTKGKYATIWKKMADGSWKVIVDIANDDGPAKPPAAPPTKK